MHVRQCLLVLSVLLLEAHLGHGEGTCGEDCAYAEDCAGLHHFDIVLLVVVGFVKGLWAGNCCCESEVRSGFARLVVW